MKNKLDKEAIKKCLKEANIYEENMSDDLMAEYYEAIKNSETSLREESQKDVEIAEEAEKSLNESANELLEAINNSESVAPSKGRPYVSKSDDDDDSLVLGRFTQDILHKTPVEEANNNNNNNNNNLDNKHEKAILAVKNNSIGFNDMPKSQNIEKNMLKIISHELKFINIQNSKKFLTASSEARIKMLYNYHLAAGKVMARYASLSTNMVPISRPITAIDHDLYVNPIISSLKEEESQGVTETTYISRSGRLTKRKMYNELDDSSDSINGSSKRTKGDEDEWKTTTKSTKSHPKTKSELEEFACVNKTINKPHTKVKRSESPDSSQDVIPTEAIDKFDELKDEPQPKPRTYQRRTPSNEEIMSRSTLFRDSTTPKRGRIAALVSAGKLEAERKKKQEEEMTRFTDSLDPTESQALDDESEKVIVDDEVEVFERRRVVPRKPIHGRKRGGASAPEALNISAKKPNLTGTEETKTTTVNGLNRRPPATRRSNTSESSSSAAFRSKKETNMTPCPLCSVSFPRREIEEHAATCGEDVFPQSAQPKRITCEVCDSVVPFSTEYEVHVKACIAKKNAGGLV